MSFKDKVNHARRETQNKALQAAMLHVPEAIEQMKKKAKAIVAAYHNTEKNAGNDSDSGSK